MSERAQPVIGLEIHVQMLTETKLLCGDLADFDGPPNSHVCPVCLGLPGATPVVNREAVELACRAALGMGCTVQPESAFDRKHYFYPDLPKGYQVTQHRKPLATGGAVTVALADGGERRVGIRRVHLEEDAGRSFHDRVPGRTGVDLNRAGAALIQIVTEPDLRSPAEAHAFLVHLRQMLEYMEVSDCSMERGSLRVDCTVSLRAVGGADAQARTAIRNLHSLQAVEEALAWEIDRQERTLAAGGPLASHTLRWHRDLSRAELLASDGGTPDYRYLPDPDLPPLCVPEEWRRSMELSLPELPRSRADRFVREYKLSPEHARTLTAGRDIADYWEAVARSGGDPETAAGWVMGEVRRALDARGGRVVEFPVRPADLAQLLALTADGTITREAAGQVFTRMLETGRPAVQILGEQGVLRVPEPVAG